MTPPRQQVAYIRLVLHPNDADVCFKAIIDSSIISWSISDYDKTNLKPVSLGVFMQMMRSAAADGTIPVAMDNSPLPWLDTYNNHIASEVAKSLYPLIPDATMSLSLTKLTKTLSLVTEVGFPSIGDNAHSAPHDAMFTLFLGVLYAKLFNDGTVTEFCANINSMFVTLAETSPAVAIGLLTGGGMEAVATFDFIGGREGRRSGNELGQERSGNDLGQETGELLQAEAKSVISRRQLSTKLNPAPAHELCMAVLPGGEACYRKESHPGSGECQT
ncbi:hypothetical protein TrRE_jg71, partial [Triparma retinervis]